MTIYIWESDNWPKFRYDKSKVLAELEQTNTLHSKLKSRVGELNINEVGEILTNEVVMTSAIEGENLDINDVRSSVANRLGLSTAGLPNPSSSISKVVEMLLDATINYDRHLTNEILHSWHKLLFSNNRYGLNDEDVGSYRKSINPMRVISGPMGKEKEHYRAPPSNIVSTEMSTFLEWFEGEKEPFDGFLRAGVTHLWFITVHPYEDGNGRIARCITDMAIAQLEGSRNRFFSMSSQIRKNRKLYYEILEETQKGDGEITNWLIWFLQTLRASINTSLNNIEKSIFIGNFYKSISEISLNERQRKALKKLIENYNTDDPGSVSNKKYVAMTKGSPESAKRDLKDLVEKGVLLKNDGSGRSTSYRLNVETIKSK